MKKSEKGFTLVEVLMVVAIAGILFALAVPSWQDYIADRATASVADDIQLNMNNARLKSVQTGQSVVVCPYSRVGDNLACGNDFGEGIFTFVDVNANGAFNPAPPGETHNPLKHDTEVRVTKFNDDNVFFNFDIANSNVLVFSPTGTMMGPISAQVTVCNQKTSVKGRRLTLLASGLVSRQIDESFC